MIHPRNVKSYEFSGNLSPYALAKHFENFRIFAHQKPDIPSIFSTGSPDFTDDVIGLMRSMSYDVTKEFHEKVGFTFPHHVTGSLMNYSKTSQNFAQSLLHEKQELVTCFKKITFIDSKTRKVAPVPNYFLENFKAQSGTRRKPFPIVPVEEAPVSSFVTKRRVQHSDHDYFQHVNSCVYIEWCMDAASEAVARGKLANFEQDLAEYRIHEMHLLFLSECFALDEVEIRVWEKPNCKHTLLFDVNKILENNKRTRVTFCILKFYPLSFGFPSAESAPKL